MFCRNVGFFSRLHSVMFQRAEIHYVAAVRLPNLETKCFQSCVKYSTLQPSAYFSKESVEGHPRFKGHPFSALVGI